MMQGDNPSAFLWHKAGTESSLDLASTFNVKEVQRMHNHDGKFLWGLGCTVKPDRLLDLIDCTGGEIKLVISKIVSKPRPQDIAHIDQKEKDVRIWRSAFSVLDKRPYEFPSGSQVVSTPYNKKGEPATRQYHFALVCQSSSPINNLEEDGLILDPMKIRMFDTKVAIRSSSTLFPVEYGEPSNEPKSDKTHRALLSVRLVAPYIVKLADPVTRQGVVVSTTTGLYPV